jgi:RNA polymerase-interacting CarD/CdnL/TRCF family regulator
MQEHLCAAGDELKEYIKRTMWSRRAQEYEAKINSGDLISIAEAVRDLYRSETQPEQSYSERQLYRSGPRVLSTDFLLCSLPYNLHR